MTKVSEMSREAFGIAVNERLADVVNKALAAKVPKEQLEEIITSVYGQTSEFTLDTAAKRIRNAFMNKIEAASATTLAGILVGSRDFRGSNRPVQYTLIKKDKKHIEVSSFSGSAPYQGVDIQIPVPALVEIKALRDPEYDSWSLKEIISYRPINKEQLEKALTSVLIPVKDITKDMAYEKGVRQSTPVVVTGTMNFIGNEVVFKQRTDDDEGKKAEIDHQLPIMMPREMAKTDADVLPCFQFTLSAPKSGENSLRCHVEAQRHGTPQLLVADIVPIAQTSLNKYRNDPVEQVNDFGKWMKGTEVIVVGAVKKFTRAFSEDKSSARNYISIAVTALVEVESKIDIGGQKTLATGPKTATPPITTTSEPVKGEIKSSKPAAAKPAKKAEPAPAPAEEDAFGDEKAASEPAPAPAPAKAAEAPATSAPKVDITGVAKAISLYCRAAGLKPADMTLDIIKTKALDIIEGSAGPVPDAVIQDAIDYLKATSAALGK